MTSLSQTALEFALEVMGWEDARITNGREWIGYNWQIDPLNSAESDCALLEYSDLNGVMAEVREWCDKRGKESSFLLQISGWKDGYTGGAYWQVKILGDELKSWSMIDNDDLCHALLAACVEAARKLKAAA